MTFFISLLISEHNKVCWLDYEDSSPRSESSKNKSNLRFLFKYRL